MNAIESTSLYKLIMDSWNIKYKIIQGFLSQSIDYITT